MMLVTLLGCIFGGLITTGAVTQNTTKAHYEQIMKESHCFDQSHDVTIIKRYKLKDIKN